MDRLKEKGGKEHDVPRHHRLDQYLHDYIEAAGIGDDIEGYLLPHRPPQDRPAYHQSLFRQDAYRIIRQRAKSAGIETRIGNS